MNKSTFTLGVPAAVIIAGGLIAAAIFLGTSSDRAEVKNTATKPANEGQAAAPKAAAKPNEPEKVASKIREVGKNDHIRGAKDAKVTVIEYSDLECPFCKRFHPTMQQIVDEYPDDVRWVYRHFPLSSHPQAEKGAQATECAGEQGKFWEMTDTIFDDGLQLSNIENTAKKAGVSDIKQFSNCLDSGKFADKVASDLADAGAAGGRGTPYSVVIAPGGDQFPINGAQPYASVKQIVDKALSTK